MRPAQEVPEHHRFKEIRDKINEAAFRLIEKIKTSQEINYILTNWEGDHDQIYNMIINILDRDLRTTD